jgi:hypothetical protein
MGINLVAVAIAGVVGFMVGTLWYSPFAFGALWEEYNPVPAEAPSNAATARIYAAALVASIFEAWVLALFLAYTDSTGAGPALWVALLLWAGFTASPSLVDMLFARRPFPAWMIGMGHRLAMTLAMAAVLVLLW